MLAQQLRQRGLSAAQSPCAILGHSWWNQPVVLLATSADGKLPTGNPSAPATSAKSPPKPASSAGTKSNQNSGCDVPLASETTPQSEQPPSPTLAAMSQLKAKLASSGLSSGRKDTPGSQPPHQDKSKSPAVAPREPPAPSMVPKPRAQLQAASFQGVPLQLGEEGNALQSMAVLTHGNVRQLEEYSKDLLAGDQRFLASLQRMGEVPQQRAAAIMQMALGVMPPPALLVWAAKEVTGQVQALLRTALRIPEPVVPPQAADGTAMQGAGEAATPAAAGATAAASEAGAARAGTALQQQPGGEGVTRTEAGAGGGGLAVEPGAVAAEDLERLRAQPWFEGALQLARLALSGQQPQPPATTELQLLRTFANLPAQRGTPTVLSWEALLTLPQLPAVLDAAAEARPTLATTLELAGLRPAGADASSTAATAAAAQWLLPQLRVATATARSRALAATGWAAAAEDSPLDADVRLTAVARGEATATAEARTAAAEWLAAANLLHRTAEQLGCAGVVSGVRQEAVAVLQVLGLPLEPPELPHMDELKVPNDELQNWIADQAKQIIAGNVNAAPPAALESRLTTVRHRLAAAGRALALLDPSPAAESGSSRDGTTATAVAPGPETSTSTGAWLRAVGTPLASALLAGGYDSLSKLRGMVPELREALVLRLLESGRAGAGTAALTAAMYGDAVAAWRAAHADNDGADNATACLRTDAVRAELDVVHERFIAPVAAVPPRRPLPSESELTEAVAALPGPERQLYNSYYALHVDGTAGAAARPDPAAEGLRLAEALAAGSGAEAGLRQLAAAGDIQAWLADARKVVLTLPPPLLALLLRFMRVQVSITPEAAQAQRNKLTALILLLAQQQHKAVADRTARGGGAAAGTAAADDLSTGVDAVAADAAARELVEFFSRGNGVQEDVAAALGVSVDEGQGGGGKGRMPKMLSRLLGSGAAKEFGYWLQAHVLNAPSGQSTHDMLGLQHTEMDVQRYLTMTHDPRLHLPRSGALSSSAAPTRAAWTDPDLRVSEAEWLQRMRPQLDAYLAAMGYRTLGDAEWGVYRDAALMEWEAGRDVRDERLEAAGASGFLNPRADEVYLQQLLERSIPQDAPLGPQSRRYLDTLLRNPTWTFADRQRAVMRLIQLNNYFARQPTAPTDGSPFASLFAVRGPDPVPRLGPLEGAAERGRLAMGARNGPGMQPLPLPEGF